MQLLQARSFSATGTSEQCRAPTAGRTYGIGPREDLGQYQRRNGVTRRVRLTAQGELSAYDTSDLLFDRRGIVAALVGDLRRVWRRDLDDTRARRDQLPHLCAAAGRDLRCPRLRILGGVGEELDSQIGELRVVVFEVATGEYDALIDQRTRVVGGNGDSPHVTGVHLDILGQVVPDHRTGAAGARWIAALLLHRRLQHGRDRRLIGGYPLPR